MASTKYAHHQVERGWYKQNRVPLPGGIREPRPHNPKPTYKRQKYRRQRSPALLDLSILIVEVVVAAVLIACLPVLLTSL